jgi:hypothetical protein
MDIVPKDPAFIAHHQVFLLLWSRVLPILEHELQKSHSIDLLLL